MESHYNPGTNDSSSNGQTGQRFILIPLGNGEVLFLPASPERQSEGLFLQMLLSGAFNQDFLDDQVEIEEQPQTEEEILEDLRREGNTLAFLDQLSQLVPQSVGPTLEEVLPQESNSVNIEKLLRILGAKDKDIEELQCSITANLISDPVKLKAKDQNDRIIWHYFEKTALQRELDINCRDPQTRKITSRGFNPNNRQPIADNEPLSAPEYNDIKRDVVLKFLKQGLTTLDASDKDIKKYSGNNILKQLEDKHFFEELVKLIKTLHAKKLAKLDIKKEKLKILYCHLTHQVIFDPVELKNAKRESVYFERAALEVYVKKNGKNPLTNVPIDKNKQFLDCTGYYDLLWDLVDNKKSQENIKDKSKIESKEEENYQNDKPTLHQSQQKNLEKQTEINEEKKRSANNTDQLWETESEESGSENASDSDSVIIEEPVIVSQTRLRKEKRKCANTYIGALLDEIEKLKKDSSQNNPERKDFCDALEELAENLNADMLAQEEKLNEKYSSRIGWHDFSSVQNSKAGKITIQTINMLKRININPDSQHQNNEPIDAKLNNLRSYENECKKILGTNHKFLKILAIVCFAAVGFVLGAAIGMGIGMAAGAWSGPGAFVTAAIGAGVGGAKGAAIGVLAASALFGLGVAGAGTFGFFKPRKFQENIEDTLKTGRKYIVRP